MLWFSILETFSCLTYVLYVNLFFLKSFLFDYDLLNALKASVVLPCNFPPPRSSGFMGPELKSSDKNKQQLYSSLGLPRWFSICLPTQEMWVRSLENPKDRGAWWASPWSYKATKQ